MVPRIPAAANSVYPSQSGSLSACCLSFFINFIKCLHRYFINQHAYGPTYKAKCYTIPDKLYTNFYESYFYNNSKYICKIYLNNGRTSSLAFLCCSNTWNAVAAFNLTNGQLSCVRQKQIPYTAFFISFMSKNKSPNSSNICIERARKNIISLVNYGTTYCVIIEGKNVFICSLLTIYYLNWHIKYIAIYFYNGFVPYNFCFKYVIFYINNTPLFYF